eukprot:11120275-Karenia_brevis.AAC.1
MTSHVHAIARFRLGLHKDQPIPTKALKPFLEDLSACVDSKFQELEADLQRGFLNLNTNDLWAIWNLAAFRGLEAFFNKHCEEAPALHPASK